MVINEIDGVPFQVTIPTLSHIQRMMLDLTTEKMWDLLGGIEAQPFIVYENTPIDTRFYLEDYQGGYYKHTPIIRVVWIKDGYELREMNKGIPGVERWDPFPIRALLTPTDHVTMEDPDGSIFEGGSYYHSRFVNSPDSPSVFNRENGIPFVEGFLKDQYAVGRHANFGDSGSQNEILRWLFYKNTMLSVDVPFKMTVGDLVKSGLISH